MHHICVRDNRVPGYQRMLPTVKPHLLSEVFPKLCEGPLPRDLDTFELSRYCVAPGFREGRRGVSSVGSELMAGGVEWGLACGVKRVVTEVETIWVLRWLQLQFLVRPLGFETKIGKQQIVAARWSSTAQPSSPSAITGSTGLPVVSFLGEHEEERMAMAV